MCGFIGQYLPGGASATHIRLANARIAHRGPDDEGYYTDGPVGFGFRRLSIIDLTAAGHQPMVSEDTALALVFNGEIYNFIELRDELRQLGFSFRSRSDTEVILAAYRQWGADCFSRFNGMWAMAIWDKRERTLTLSRDRFGEKPLYYARHGDGYIFASEMKALFPFFQKTPPPNDQIIFDYLAYAFHDHTNETFFSGIKQLDPGTIMRISEKNHEIRPYWTLEPRGPSAASFDEAAETFGRLFTDSIRLRLRSDVPIGTCLSGGLDSSSIAILANRLLQASGRSIRQKTFTACSQNPRYDERRYSNLVNEQIHAERYEVFPDPERFRDDYDRLLAHQEEPFLSMSIYAQWELMRKAHESGVTVMLDGQGGDEVLAGYIPFFASFLAQRIRSGNVIGFIREFTSFLGRHRASFFDILPTFAIYLLPKKVGDTLLQRSGKSEITTLEKSFRTRHYRYPSLPRPFANQFKNHLYRLLTSTGVRALLHYEDRNAMAFSIESRVPFLDHRLAEFTLGLPDEYLMSDGVAKKLLRASMRGTLPDPIRARHEKMGFVVPQKEWFLREISPDWEAALNTPNARINAYVDPRARHRAQEGFLSGQSSLYTLMWRWYNLETWLKKFHG